MTSGLLLISIVAALVLGVVEGEILSFIAGDPKGQRIPNIIAGLVGSATGWILGMTLPVFPEFKFPAILGLSAHFSAIGLYVYFVSLHPRSRLGDDVESNWPLNETHRDLTNPNR